MNNPLTMKLEQFAGFSPDERGILDDLVSKRRQSYAPGAVVIPEGERVDEIHLVMSGLAARSKTLPDGSRQIMAYLIPGDLCDVEVFVLEAMDHEILAVSETVCALIPARKMEAMLTDFSKLTKALWWSTMTDSAVLRERIIDHGRRDARERMAHLLYEMLIRFRMIGQAGDNSYPLPVTQDQLADATGMTPMHVNRTLKQLRHDGIVEFRQGRVTIPDPAQLKKVARFEADYLHLMRTDKGSSDVSARAGDLV
ncbi:MAG: Crp/Fnr family transcriptional regulator [Caulobacteraceae bacterium]|nr:Crp/Fnr family transcriptional regulator [Caulobacteraceae bacterium]